MADDLEQTIRDNAQGPAEAAGDAGRVLRNRARYEVANNSYAKGIVLTLANDVIGTGPQLQMLTPDAEANRFVETEFAAWAQATSLAEKLRTMRMARAEDGEAFAILTNNDQLDSAVKLDLRLIEADQVATPERGILSVNSVDGIVFDAAGKVFIGEAKFWAGLTDAQPVSYIKSLPYRSDWA